MDAYDVLHDKILAIVNDLGIYGPSDDDLGHLVALASNELETRVGERISRGMTDEQLKEFEDFVEAGDEAGCDRFLKTNAPDTLKIVDECLTAVLFEIETRLGSGFGADAR